MPVARVTETGGAQLLAIGARQAAATVLLRPDLTAEPASRLWRSITPAGRPPGLALPGQPVRLALTASINGTAAGAVGPLTASVSVQGADGIAFSVPAGTLSAHYHRLVAVLAPGHQADYPLRLLGISLVYALPARPVRGTATVQITGLSLSPAMAGPFPPRFATAAALGAWQAAVAVPAPYHGTVGLVLPALAANPGRGRPGRLRDQARLRGQQVRCRRPAHPGPADAHRAGTGSGHPGDRQPGVPQRDPGAGRRHRAGSRQRRHDQRPDRRDRPRVPVGRRRAGRADRRPGRAAGATGGAVGRAGRR